MEELRRLSTPAISRLLDLAASALDRALEFGLVEIARRRPMGPIYVGFWKAKFALLAPGISIARLPRYAGHESGCGHAVDGLPFFFSRRHDERDRSWNDDDEQGDSNSNKPILYLLFALLREHCPSLPVGTCRKLRLHEIIARLAVRRTMTAGQSQPGWGFCLKWALSRP
jgi:hypothetical protein